MTTTEPTEKVSAKKWCKVLCGEVRERERHLATRSESNTCGDAALLNWGRDITDMIRLPAKKSIEQS